MYLDTGYSLVSIGKMSFIGTRDNEKARSFIGLYVKDIFGKECIYEITSVWASKIIDRARKDNNNNNIDIAGIIKNVIEIQEQHIASRGWVELMYSEVRYLAKLESDYNIQVWDL